MGSKNLDFHEIWFTKSKETYQIFYFALKLPSFLLNSLLENNDLPSVSLAKEVSPTNLMSVSSFRYKPLKIFFRKGMYPSEDNLRTRF